MTSRIMKNTNVFKSLEILRAIKIIKKNHTFKKIIINILSNDSTEQKNILIKEKKIIKDRTVKDCIKKNKNK